MRQSDLHGDRILSAEAESAAQPDDTHLRGHLASLLLGVGQLDRAIGVFREGLQRSPADHGLWFGLSHAYHRAGLGAEALDAAERAAALAPDDFHSQMHLGYLLTDEGTLDRAETVFARASEMQPADSRVALALASVLERLGRIGEAAAAAERAIALAPGDEAAIACRDRLREQLLSLGDRPPAQERIVGVDRADTAPAAEAASAVPTAPQPPAQSKSLVAPPKKKGFLSGLLGW